MFVTLLGLALAAAPAQGSVCKAFCSDKQVRQELTQCQQALKDSGQDLKTCEQDLKFTEQARKEASRVADHYLDTTNRLVVELENCKAAQKVCPTKKRKAAPKPKPVVVVKEEPKPCCQAAQPVTVVNNITVNAGAAAVAATESGFETLLKRERPSFLFGVRGAGGAALCAPTGIGLLGFRMNYLPIHLGLDVYTNFYHGTGAQLLVYPLQTLPVMWHLNVGAIGFGGRPFVTPDLPRQIDLTLGTGIEVRVLPFLWVTADIQARMANPVAISQTGQQFSAVLGKSLLQTQGMLGLMLRTW